MTTFLSVLDVILCGLIVLAALDYLRMLNPFDRPMTGLAFYLLVVGAFGSIVELVTGHPPSLIGAAMHAGVIAYAWEKRHGFFEREQA